MYVPDDPGKFLNPSTQHALCNLHLQQAPKRGDMNELEVGMQSTCVHGAHLILEGRLHLVRWLVPHKYMIIFYILKKKLEVNE
jgi:hypothetical protein